MTNVKDIINGFFWGCIQNKAILISMSVGRHDMGVWKYWIFFFFGLKKMDWTDNYDIQKRKGVQLFIIGTKTNKHCLSIRI